MPMAGSRATVVFLRLDGVRLRPDEEGYEALIMGVANRKAGRAEIAGLFRRKTAKG